MTDTPDTSAIGDPPHANRHAAALITTLEALLAAAIDGRITGLAYAATNAGGATWGYHNLTQTEALIAGGRIAALGVAEDPPAATDATPDPAAPDPAFEVETAWEEFNTAALPTGMDGDLELFSIDDMTDSAHDLYTIAKDLAAQLAAAKDRGAL